MHKGQPAFLRPSRVLGFLLLVEVIVAFAVVYWQSTLIETDTSKLNTGQWILVVGALLAMSGWISTSWVTIKNSVKQHTINTLLQSRLSATYMGYADTVNNHFHKFGLDHGVDPAGWGTMSPIDEIHKPSLRYILNYFEYVALGIRHGDLHEGLLHSSLRSILCNSCIYSKKYIDETKAKQPLAFCNLLWLMERWEK